MKVTMFECLESMMFEALTALKQAHEELVRTHVEFLSKRTDESAAEYGKARQKHDDTSKRYAELLSAQKIIKEMESKGIEI